MADYRRVASEVEAKGFKVYGDYKVSFWNGMMSTRIASTKGTRKFRPDDSQTPCMRCEHLAYSISSLIQKNDEWPVIPSCEASIKDDRNIPAQLDTFKPSIRKCPDYIERNEPNTESGEIWGGCGGTSSRCDCRGQNAV